MPCWPCSPPPPRPTSASAEARKGSGSVATEEGGEIETQAGSHPLALTTEVNFNLGPESPGEPGVPFTDGDLKDLRLDLPPGLIENPAAVPRCALAQFHTPRESPFEESLSGESCPDRTQIGVVEVRSSYGGGSTRTFGVFNLVPPPGAPSQLGFNAYGAPIVFIPHVRQADGEYGLSLEARNIPQLVDLYGFSLTIWGTPWASSTTPSAAIASTRRTRIRLGQMLAWASENQSPDRLPDPADRLRGPARLRRDRDLVAAALRRRQPYLRRPEPRRLRCARLQTGRFGLRDQSQGVLAQRL